MAKSEGPSIWNFMHQMLTVGHTEHTRTIIPGIGGLPQNASEDAG